MVVNAHRLRENETPVRRMVEKYRLDPSLANKRDYLWDDRDGNPVYARPGDMFERQAMESLPFVNHRMMYIGSGMVVHSNLIKTIPLMHNVEISSLHDVHEEKEILRKYNTASVPYTRYQAVMNALHSVGSYPYCPILANCQNQVSSWLGVNQYRDTDGVAQVLISFFLSFFALMIAEFYVVKLVASIKKEIHKKPIVFV